MAPTKSKSKAKDDETRGQRTSRTFRDAAGLPERTSDGPKDLSEGPTELAEYTGPEGGYGGEREGEGTDNLSAIHSAETAQPGDAPVPGPEVAANPDVDGQVYEDLQAELGGGDGDKDEEDES